MIFSVLGTGLLIFLARILDVSLGTIRTIVLVQGRVKMAFVLGFLECAIWITVVSAVIENIRTSPVLGLFFAFGFATGNAVGIWLEDKMALGNLVIRVFSKSAGQSLAKELRRHGQGVTSFEGQGMTGPVTELYIACRRRDVHSILEIVERADAEAFYTVAQARDLSNVLRPTFRTPGGWRAVFKKK